MKPSGASGVTGFSVVEDVLEEDVLSEDVLSEELEEDEEDPVADSVVSVSPGVSLQETSAKQSNAASKPAISLFVNMIFSFLWLISCEKCQT